ncbi:MAG: hypothetical protein ABI870_13000 [Rhodanobacter sp.]
MNLERLSIALAASLLASSVWAQTTKPLNLKLPPGELPAASATVAKPASGSTAPGVYYGDTSGKIENDTGVADSAASECDDSKFNQTQVHGSVSTGVVSGSHMGTGTWNAGEVNLSKAFGSCDHPTGGVSISIGTEAGHFHGH